MNKPAGLGKWLVVIATFGMATAKATDFESDCRIKAKQLATESYRSCVKENKTAQIETLKKDYEGRLKKLKQQYEQEIQNLSLGEKNKGLQKKQATKSSPSVASSPIESEIEQSNDETMMDIPEPIPVQLSR